MAQSKVRKLPRSLLSSHLQPLVFDGQVYYCHQKDDCNFICLDLNERSRRERMNVGFDLEWKVSYQKDQGSNDTALVQLCVSDKLCYLFHLSAMSGFPTELGKLLENEEIMKLGVGIMGDVSRFKLEHNIHIQGIIDLSILANRVLHMNENWSLDGLLKHLLQKQLDKNRKIRCGNWEQFPLSDEQKIYAAADAYAGLVIYQNLTKRDTESGTW